MFTKPTLWCYAALAGTLLFVSTGCSRDSPHPLPLAGFKVEFGEQNIPTQMVADKTVSADISIKNASERTWPSKPNDQGKYAVNLSYHWLDHRKQVVVFDGLRTPLLRDLNPGESVKLNASIHAPQRPGQYTLEVTLVQEFVAWFPENDGGQLDIPVNVVEAVAKNAEALKEEVNGGPADKPKQEGEQRSRSWAVQVGSYSQRKDAESRAKKLGGKGYDAYVVATSVKGKRRYQLRIGRLASRAEAVKLLGTLKAKEHLTHSFVASSR